LPPLFSVSQYTTWHQSFEEDVELYARLGVDGIELCERKLASDPGRRRDQLALLREAGLRVTSVQPRVHALFEDSMSPDGHDPRERLEQYRRTIDLVAETWPGEDVPLVTVTGKAPAFDFARAHQTARELYPALADYAGERGLRIALEPLSPVLMNTDTFICTLSGALRLIDQVGRPNFGLLVDTWHIWDELLLAERLDAVGQLIFGVHISDWPRGEPRQLGDRAVVGEGRIDLPAVLGAIDRAGYRGAYCLEIFSVDELPDSLWLADQAEVVERSRAGFLRAWEQRPKGANGPASTSLARSDEIRTRLMADGGPT
jgi:sugar phosphate isomerase/epimerase